MDLVGKVVQHANYGKGEIVELISQSKGNYINVTFQGKVKRFAFPGGFKNALKLVSDEKDIKELALILAHAEQKEAELKEQSDSAVNKNLIKVKEPGNLAIKCNYCDGGADEFQYGYRKACTDENIARNIKANRTWCSFEESDCFQYYNGNISRKMLDSKCKNGGFVCYESQMLRNWYAGAGVDQSGKPRRLPVDLVGNLAVFTTKLPQQAEEERFIFGAFIVNVYSTGDDDSEGYISAYEDDWEIPPGKELWIELKKDEAPKLKFWEFHFAKQISWTRRLMLYYKDEEAVQILKKICEIKKGKEDELTAKQMLKCYCQEKNINPGKVGKPNGSLLRI